MCQYEYVIKIHSKTQKTAPWELIDFDLTRDAGPKPHIVWLRREKPARALHRRANFDSQNCYFRKSKLLISKVKKKLKVLELDDTYALSFD